MEPYKKRLHLDKTEVAFLLGLVFLISSLMFSFGLLLGFGLKNGNVTSDTHASAGHTAETDKKKQDGKRTPASIEEATGKGKSKETLQSAKNESESGVRLRQDFKESKQRSLVEMNLRSTEAVQPKSLVDSKAHFASHSEWSRNPSSEKNNEKFSQEVANETNQEIAKFTDEPTKEVPQGVKGLFERKPTSQDVFSPAPGTYTVQIASYATSDESNAKIIDLRRSNFNEAYVQPVKLKNGEVWYRVSVGSFPSPSWAKKTGEKLVRQKLASDFVIRQVAQE